MPGWKIHQNFFAAGAARGVDPLSLACYAEVEQLNCYTNAMAIVTVKNKYQVVIPKSVRDKIGINIGDLLEAGVERGKVTFSPKSVVDRALAEGLEDMRKGRVRGPFDTVDEMLASLKGKRGRPVAGKPSRAR